MCIDDTLMHTYVLIMYMYYNICIIHIYKYTYVNGIYTYLPIYGVSNLHMF